MLFIFDSLLKQVKGLILGWWTWLLIGTCAFTFIICSLYLFACLLVLFKICWYSFLSSFDSSDCFFITFFLYAANLLGWNCTSLRRLYIVGNSRDDVAHFRWSVVPKISPVELQAHCRVIPTWKLRASYLPGDHPIVLGWWLWLHVGEFVLLWWWIVGIEVTSSGQPHRGIVWLSSTCKLRSVIILMRLVPVMSTDQMKIFM